MRLLEKLVFQLDQIAALVGFLLVQGQSVIIASSRLDKTRLVASETDFDFLGISNQFSLRGLLLV